MFHLMKNPHRSGWGSEFTIWIMFTLRHQDSSNICDLIDLYPATSGSGNIYEPSGSTLVYMKKPGITRSIGELKFLNSFWRESTIPSKPNIPCKHPGCAALVPFGTKYCEKHKGMHPEEVRSAASRGYGSAWRKASKQLLILSRTVP